MTESAPIACSLNVAELRGRLAEMAGIGADALLGEADGGALRFRNEPGILARLKAVIAAESECCAFLRFELRTGGGELELEMLAPEGAERVVEALVDAFQAGTHS